MLRSKYRQFISLFEDQHEHLEMLFRHFPYIDLSVQYIPLYAYVYATGLSITPWDMALLLPFILGHAAGFAHNNLMDDKDPSFRRNPLSKGQISPAAARRMIGGLLLASLLAFILLYDNRLAWLAYGAYVLLGLSYSGLGIRLKESLLGPFIASFCVYTAGALAIAYELIPEWDNTVYGLMAGIFLIFVGREIFHTYIDRENDQRAGYQTFGVRLGIKTQLSILALACLGGTLCLLFSLYSYSGGWPEDMLGLALVAILSCAAGLQFVYSLRFAPYHPATAFRLYRLCFALYGAYLLQLAPLVAALFVWVFLINRRS